MEQSNPDMPRPAEPLPSGDGDGMATAAAIEAAKARIANPTPELADALHHGYEPHDIGLKGVFAFLIALVITMVVVLAAMWGVMMLFVGYDRSKDPIATPVRVEHLPVAQPNQPSPQHDFLDHEDMQAMREETSKVLNSSGTSPSGRHYISINEAMERVLPKLPVKPAAARRQTQVSSALGGETR
jgi:hypothetical protein